MLNFFRTHQSTAGSLKIGDSYQGGIIFYLLLPRDTGYDPNVQHGLIYPDRNVGHSIPWDDETPQTTGATGTAIGTGRSNTNTIVAAQEDGNYAAFLCADWNYNGYNDWFLPSRDELMKLMENRDSEEYQLPWSAGLKPGEYIGGESIYFWTSTESSQANAVAVETTNGDSYRNQDKTLYSEITVGYVRAVRSF